MVDANSGFKLKLHHRNKTYELKDVDPDKYSHIVLLSDVTELIFNDPDGWKTKHLSLTCDVPGSSNRLFLDSEARVTEMLRLHVGHELINIYVGDESNETFEQGIIVALEDDGIVGNYNAGNSRTGRKKKQPERKKAQTREGNKHRKSGRLAGKNRSLTDPNNESMISEEDSDDQLYAISDDDEMHVDIDDELLIKYCCEGVEHESNSDSGLSNYQSDDEVSTEHESDSEFENDLLGACLNRVEFHIREGEKFKLIQGMMFESVDSFRKVLYEYSILWGFTLVRLKNEKKRVTARCGDDVCEWRVHASIMPDGVTYMVKTCNPDHTCTVKPEITDSAKWMGKKIEELVRADRNVKPEMIRTELLKYGLHPTDMQIFRARRCAQELVDGNHSDSYKLLPKYCLMVLRTNPGSVAKIHYDMPLGSTIPSIKRFFLGLHALKKGFLEGCKPFIGFDGCHLKNPYGGVLLTAIAHDADGGLFPIAFAVVESENKDSWCFFFHWMSELLDGFPADKEWTFMTDRQKGLVEAIAHKVPHAIHRKCCRHMFTNFRAKFPALLLRKLFWAAARAYTEKGYKLAMSHINRLQPEAHAWLEEIGPEMWARHTFSETLKNAHITNNSSESFNSWVDDLREKSVLTLVDSLRARMMNKLQKRYQKACAWKHSVTSMVVEKLQEVAADCRTLTFMYSNGTTYEVKEEKKRFVVDIAAMSCDCKVWNHTGIPCKHGAVVLIDQRARLENYCDRMLSKDMYLKSYTQIINPIPDEFFWPEFAAGEITVCLPPKMRRRIGRPKKARRREDGEAPAVGFKRSSTLRCARCSQFGHNKRTCAGGPVKKTRVLKKATKQIVGVQALNQVFGSARAASLLGADLSNALIHQSSGMQGH